MSLCKPITRDFDALVLVIVEVADEVEAVLVDLRVVRRLADGGHIVAELFEIRGPFLSILSDKTFTELNPFFVNSSNI